MSDSYLDFHRARMLHLGATPKDRIETAGANDFIRSILPNSPNRVIITYKEEEFACILASGNSRVGTQTERKVTQYLETTRDLRLPEGAVFTTIDLDIDEEIYWIVLHREIHPYYPYFKYKIVELNYKIKYVDDFGIVKEIPVYINGTGEFDIKEYFKMTSPSLIQTPNRALNVILAENPDFKSDNQKRKLRFIIGEEAWHYVDSDKISIPGIYFATLEKETKNLETDDLEQAIADVNLIGKDKIISNFGTSTNINIGKEYQDINFYYTTNGRIKTADIVYSDYDPTIIKIEKGKIIPLDFGTTKLIATDKISQIEKIVTINIIENPGDYFEIVGNDVVIIQETLQYKITSNLEYKIIYDEDFLKLTRNENGFELTAKLKMGKTNIDFYSEDDVLIKSLAIEIISLWG